MKNIYLRRGFKTQAEKQSIAIRRKLGLNSYDRLPAAKLAKHLRVKVIFPVSIPGVTPAILEKLANNGNSCWSAFTIAGGEKALIVLNENHSDARMESDIFHELSHVICKHDMKGFSIIGKSLLRDYDNEQEEEAKWLGGSLHIPRAALEWALKRKMDTAQIGEYFLASIDMVNYRINVTGIGKQYRNRKYY